MNYLKLIAVASVSALLLSSCGVPLVKRTIQAPARLIRTATSPLF